MKRQLLDCRTGNSPLYGTSLEVTEQAGELCFLFTAEHTAFFCPYDGYNGNHYEGDVCEIFIGTEPDRSHYYEIEVTPENHLFFAKITYAGVTPSGEPVTTVERLPEAACFVSSRVVRSRNGYTAELRMDRARLCKANERLFFNAFRIETDGGQRDKHLFALQPTLQPRFHVPESFLTLEE